VGVVVTYRIPLVENTWGPQEREAILAVVDSGRMTMGPRVAEFEAAFAQTMHAKHAVMVTSGSMALLLAAFWYSDQVGRYKVVMPAVGWPTAAWSFIMAGCQIMFVDVDPETLTMVDNPHTTSGFLHVPVHLMGNKSVISDGRVIEDGCEGVHPLSGDLACYSTFFSHHLNTIEGGMVCTNDPLINDWLRSARAHGWTREYSKWKKQAIEESYSDIDPRFLFYNIGFNMKPTEIAAAVGLVQLRKLPESSAGRRLAFMEIANGIESLSVKPMRLINNPSPFAFPILCPDKNTRQSMSTKLEALGIETRPIAGGNLTRQPGFRKYTANWTTYGAPKFGLPGADYIHDCAFFIGLYPGMDTEYVVESIKASL
jgi:CDP-6-deoxy-D-xylo-4-hexulose-3-dehydrase